MKNNASTASATKVVPGLNEVPSGNAIFVVADTREYQLSYKMHTVS